MENTGKKRGVLNMLGLIIGNFLNVDFDVAKQPQRKLPFRYSQSLEQMQIQFDQRAM